MSDKKRTTVTTIETHEVRIIRRIQPNPADGAEKVLPVEAVQPNAAISPSSEVNTDSEMSKEEER